MNFKSYICSMEIDKMINQGYRVYFMEDTTMFYGKLYKLASKRNLYICLDFDKNLIFIKDKNLIFIKHEN